MAYVNYQRHHEIASGFDFAANFGRVWRRSVDGR